MGKLIGKSQLEQLTGCNCMQGRCYLKYCVTLQYRSTGGVIWLSFNGRYKLVGVGSHTQWKPYKEQFEGRCDNAWVRILKHHLIR